MLDTSLTFDINPSDIRAVQPDPRNCSVIICNIASNIPTTILMNFLIFLQKSLNVNHYTDYTATYLGYITLFIYIASNFCLMSQFFHNYSGLC